MRLLALILLAGALCLWYFVWLSYHLQKEYFGLKKGDSEAFLTSTFGKPYQITGPPDSYAFGGEEGSFHINKGECIKVFHYHRPLSLDGEEWEMGFDGAGKVLSKADLLISA